VKYVSCDLETMRVNNKAPDAILMASFVFEDTKNILPLKDLPHYTAIVDHGKEFTTMISPVAIAMNSWLFCALALHQGTKENYLSDLIRNDQMIERAKEALNQFPVVDGTYGLICGANIFLDSHLGAKRRSINLAGKNVGTFDLQFLPPELESRFRGRVIDSGNAYIDWEEDEQVPASDVVLKRAGINSEVSHNTYGDALDVIASLRKFYIK